MGNRVVVQFWSEDLRQSDEHSLALNFKGEFGAVGANYNVSGSLESFIRSVNKHSAVNVTISAFGGGGVSPLSEVIKSESDLKNFENVISSYVAKYMTASNAVPTSAVTATFDGLLGVVPEDTDRKLKKLADIYREYSYEESRVSRIKELLLPTDNGERQYLSKDQYSYLSNIYKILQKKLDDLDEIGYSCAKSTSQASCRSIQFEPNRVVDIDWPVNPEPNCVSWIRGNDAPVCQQCEFSVIFVNADFAQTAKGNLPAPSFPFSCSHMPSSSKVQSKYKGNVTLADGINAQGSYWIDLHLCPIRNCPEDDQNPRSLQRILTAAIWSPIEIERYDLVPANGIASVQVILEHCQWGTVLSQCSTAPPANNGSAGFVDGVPVPGKLTIKAMP
jgi:hypothetical protein